MIFEKLRMSDLGKGGLKSDLALDDEVNDALNNVAMLVLDEKAVGNGTITIKLTVIKSGEQSVAIGHSVSIKQPGIRRKATAAFLGANGELFTAQHKQEALDFEPLPRIPRAIGGQDD